VKPAPDDSPLRIDRHEVSPPSRLRVKRSASSTPPAVAATRLSRTRLDLIESAGRLCQIAGLPRTTGQIFGLLFLSPRPLGLDEIAELLAISKASASTGTRQLMTIHALRQVWKPGDRRDYFEAVGELREVLRAIYRSLFQPRITKSRGRIDLLLETLEEDKREGLISREEYQFCRERIQQMASIQGRVEKALPIAEKLL
jgi:HTH-type transcriptional regulator, glycine betaine synthesis regulator